MLLLLLPLTLTGPTANAAPKPRQGTSIAYGLDIHGFNDGAPYLLRGAQAQAALGESGAVVFRLASSNWLDKDIKGTYVKVAAIKSRYANRTIAEMFSVYRLDVDKDQVPEVLVVARSEAIGDGRRYAPTLLRQTPAGYEPVWAARMAGQSYRVVDIRDLNADGAAELLLAGDAGSSGYYQFHEVVGHTSKGAVTLPIRHTDSVHYVDLDRDGSMEIVVRERVGRRGPAYQWTYVDHLHSWDGATFGEAYERFPRYHDVQTLPMLLGGLIDHYDAKVPILMEKVEALKRVRRSVLERIQKPPRFQRRLVQALASLQRGQRIVARRRLEELDRLYPYDTQLLLAMARVHAAGRRWEMVLEYAIRALTVTPQDREAWWSAGLAFVELAERSSAVASFHHAVRLGGPTEEGVAFLLDRRGDPGASDNLRKAIDAALDRLKKP